MYALSIIISYIYVYIYIYIYVFYFYLKVTNFELTGQNGDQIHV